MISNVLELSFNNSFIIFSPGLRPTILYFNIYSGIKPANLIIFSSKIYNFTGFPMSKYRFRLHYPASKIHTSLWYGHKIPTLPCDAIVIGSPAALANKGM
jgi:hypothetical protein